MLNIISKYTTKVFFITVDKLNRIKYFDISKIIETDILNKILKSSSYKSSSLFPYGANLVQVTNYR